jgi:hypothetical protein
MAFRAPGDDEGGRVAGEVAEGETLGGGMPPYRGNDLDSFAFGLLDILIAAVERVAEELCGTTLPLRGCVDGGLEGVGILVVCRFDLHVSDEVAW